MKKSRYIYKISNGYYGFRFPQEAKESEKIEGLLAKFREIMSRNRKRNGDVKLMVVKNSRSS